MTLEEAKTFLITCIYIYIYYVILAIGLAMNRDCSSGGFIRLLRITKDEVVREVI